MQTSTAPTNRTALETLTALLGRLDDNGTLPLYAQLQRALRTAIESGQLAPDSVLPPERQLAAALGISRITVRNAIEPLVEEGLLVSRQGAGNFVRASVRVDKSFALLTSFSEDMRARGMEPSSEWLKRGTGQVNPDEALKLGLRPGSQVHRFRRLRFADGRPMAIETATIAPGVLRSADEVGDSLYEALARAGMRPVRALQRLRALLLDEEQAKLLGTEPDAAGLSVERIGFLPDGRAIELSLSIYRGDTYDFVAELGGPPPS